MSQRYKRINDFLYSYNIIIYSKKCIYIEKQRKTIIFNNSYIRLSVLIFEINGGDDIEI